MNEYLVVALVLIAAFFIPTAIYLLVMRILCGKIR